MKVFAIGNRFCGIVWTVAGLLLAALAGCGGREDAGTVHNATGNGTGNVPQRIVCGTPAVAETVFALGLGDRVVGVSDYTIYPPDAEAVAGVGGWANPNRERLLMLRPDLIISQGRHETLAAFARAYGIRFHTVKLDTLADVHAAIDGIAGILGVPERGVALNADIRRAIRSFSETIPTGPPKRVLLLIGRTSGSLTGLGTVGPGTFLDDMIRVAGGTNVFGDAMGAYPQVSKETLLVRAPEVILEINPGGLAAETIDRLRADWQVMGDLPAVRDGRIHYLTNDYLLIPGPRMGLIAGVFAEAIHPEIARE